MGSGPSRPWGPGLTAPDVLWASSTTPRTGPDRPAVKDLDVDLNYGELLADAGRVAAGLRSRGWSRGIGSPSTCPTRSTSWWPHWPVCGWGPSSSRWRSPIRRPGWMSSSAIAHRPSWSPPTGRVMGIRHRPSTRDGGCRSRRCARVGGPPAPGRISDRVAYAIYTSGTTGTPKGVLIGNRAFAAAVAATADALGLTSATRTLCVSPFHFDGSFGTLFPTLFSGGAVVIRPREALLFPRTFFNASGTRERSPIRASRPAIYACCCPARRWPAGRDRAGGGAGWRGLLGQPTSRPVGGGAGRPVFNRYGPTETTIAVTHAGLRRRRSPTGRCPSGIPIRGDLPSHRRRGALGRLAEPGGRVVHRRATN